MLDTFPCESEGDKGTRNPFFLVQVFNRVRLWQGIFAGAWNSEGIVGKEKTPSKKW
jgi:hypothetical protein